MDPRRPFLTVAAGATVLAAILSLIFPSRITIKPVFVLIAVVLALVRTPSVQLPCQRLETLSAAKVHLLPHVNALHDTEKL